jgi:hypothetical protein
MSTRGTEAFDQEIAQEKAASLGLAGRRLEAALAALRDHDARAGTAAHAGARSDPTAAIRDDLVAQAAYRAQNVIVQRESLGLRDHHSVFRLYAVPREVIARIGARPR